MGKVLGSLALEAEASPHFRAHTRGRYSLGSVCPGTALTPKQKGEMSSRMQAVPPSPTRTQPSSEIPPPSTGHSSTPSPLQCLQTEIICELRAPLKLCWHHNSRHRTSLPLHSTSTAPPASFHKSHKERAREQSRMSSCPSLESNPAGSEQSPAQNTLLMFTHHLY